MFLNEINIDHPSIYTYKEIQKKWPIPCVYFIEDLLSNNSPRLNTVKAQERGDPERTET